MRVRKGWLMVKNPSTNKLVPFFLNVRSEDIISTDTVPIATALKHTSLKWKEELVSDNATVSTYRFTRNFSGNIGDVDSNGEESTACMENGILYYYLFKDGRASIRGDVQISNQGIDGSGNEDSIKIIDLPYAVNKSYSDVDNLVNGYNVNVSGSSWTSVPTLPYEFYDGSAVVLNNEIHILGGSVNKTAHYKWNGSSWTSVSTLPYKFYNGSAVVLNNEIHLLGGTDNETKHYKWNGSSWTSVSTLPYDFVYGSAVVLNREIHILGTMVDEPSHYKWNGSSWTSVSTLPYKFYNGSAVAVNNKIHLLGGTDNKTAHYECEDVKYTIGSKNPVKISRMDGIIPSYLGSYLSYHFIGASQLGFGEELFRLNIVDYFNKEINSGLSDFTVQSLKKYVVDMGIASEDKVSQITAQDIYNATRYNISIDFFWK